MKRLFPFGLLLVGLLSGCMVGPNYKRPEVDSPAAFRGADAVTTESLADLPWWDVFGDETLKGLVATALTNNYDLRIAVSRIEQASALETQTRAGLFPAAGYDAQASRGRNASLGNAVVNNKTGSTFLGDLNVAWELDLWGRIRRLDEAAQAAYLASVETRRGVTLSLVSGVAQAYFELLALDQLLEITRRNVESFKASLKIFDDRLRGGVASKLETARAEAALASTEAVVPDLERQILLKENQLNALLGRNPGPIPRAGSLLGQPLPAGVPAGLPSALLERRPDIRAAEQNLRAANAQIGAALGDMLPHIGLTTLFGGVSSDLADIASGKARAWSLGATVAGPIFQGNRLAGRYRQTQAARQEAELLYRQAALTAFHDVSDALVSREKLEAMRVSQARAVEAYKQAVTVSLERYNAGRAAYFEVLEAQQQLFPAENALVGTQLNQRLAVVQLYKALGGGW